MTRTIICCIGAIGLGGATLAAAPAAAGEPDAYEKRIYFGDLDVETDQGHRILKLRVSRAARSLCRSSGPVAVETWRAEKACLEQTRAHGFAQADALRNAPRGSVIVQSILISAR
ncbi:UrcA family protein [Sphingomicrobium arenosum]|uniref:UrcA family protein n=1 Tax=Sphingomicrobium arenosum TaxID=2233861 RepID=UPI002240215A|nr:UrcA family protein [Sphingomicrobium arenosum]